MSTSFLHLVFSLLAALVLWSALVVTAQRSVKLFLIVRRIVRSELPEDHPLADYIAGPSLLWAAFYLLHVYC